MYRTEKKSKGCCNLWGFSLTETHENADLIVFNTCAVRESAEDRVYGMLGVIKKYKEIHPRTIVTFKRLYGFGNEDPAKNTGTLFVY